MRPDLQATPMAPVPRTDPEGRAGAADRPGGAIQPHEHAPRALAAGETKPLASRAAIAVAGRVVAEVVLMVGLLQAASAAPE